MLLLDTIRKAYGESNDTITFDLIHIWWVTLKVQSQGHSDFEALYLVKEQPICYYEILIGKHIWGVDLCYYIWP